METFSIVVEIEISEEAGRPIHTLLHTVSVEAEDEHEAAQIARQQIKISVW